MPIPADTRYDRFCHYIYPLSHIKCAKDKLRHVGRELAKLKALERKYASAVAGKQFHNVEAQIEAIAKQANIVIETFGCRYAILQGVGNRLCALLAILKNEQRGGVVAVTRGAYKFNSGTWDNEGIEHLSRISYHELHVCLKDPTRIAYHRSWAGWYEDRQSTTTLEKYLTEFSSDLYPAEKIREYGMLFKLRNGENRLVYVENTDPDGWVEAYNSDQVSSCMQGDNCVRVYAYPGNNIRLATLVSPTNFKVLARCIVRNNDDGTPRGFIRVYPDQCCEPIGAELLAAITADGYGGRTNLDGVKVQKIGAYNDDDEFVMPYIDSGAYGNQSASEFGDYMLLGGDDFECENTNGYTSRKEEEEGERCDMCGEIEDNCTNDIDADDDNCTVCASCLSSHYTYAIVGREHGGYTRAYVRDTDIAETTIGDASSNFASSELSFCDVSDVWCESTSSVLDCDGDELEYDSNEVSGDSGYVPTDDMSSQERDKVDDHILYVHKTHLEDIRKCLAEEEAKAAAEEAAEEAEEEEANAATEGVEECQATSA
jgi:hypothetical protein